MGFEVDRVLRRITEVRYKPPINYREKILSKPILALEAFDGACFLEDMEKIGRLTVESGLSTYDSDLVYSWFLNFQDEIYNYRSSVLVDESNKDKYSRVSIARTKKIDDTTDSFYLSNSGSSVVISDSRCVGGQKILYTNLDKKNINDINTFTSEFLSKFCLIKGEERSLVVDRDFYCDNTDRNSLISNLRRSVILEKNHRYNLSRGISGYLSELSGLSGTFKYIEQFLESKIVVDVGTGSGFGWFDISKKYSGNLDFWATNLVYREELRQMFGNRIRFTPVEFMKGFESESVAGIIALNSVAYSSNPKMAISQIDRVLVPGGIFKASFRNPNDDFRTMEYGFQTHERFTRQLIDLGYDVALCDGNVVLALKPGTDKEAIDVFRSDLVASL